MINGSFDLLNDGYLIDCLISLYIGGLIYESIRLLNMVDLQIFFSKLCWGRGME